MPKPKRIVTGILKFEATVRKITIWLNLVPFGVYLTICLVVAQLGSISYLGPVYPNTELFRIVELFDDNGLIHTRCIRVAEPPEELVWTQVSAADHQSQYRSQAIWSPTKVDSFNEDELQLIFFSFANSSLSLDMQERFHQSRMVRIWPPWHEHLLQLEDGSVTTVKLVTRFITDAIY
jgi:hypothetical protein